MDAAKCHVCGKEAVVWSGRYVLPPDMVPSGKRTECIVGTGFCDEHKNTNCQHEFGLAGCFGVWDPKYGIKPLSRVGRKSQYYDMLKSRC